MGGKHKLPNPFHWTLKFFCYLVASLHFELCGMQLELLFALKRQALLYKLCACMKDVQKIQTVSITSVIAMLLNVPK